MKEVVELDQNQTGAEVMRGFNQRNGATHRTQRS